MTSEKEATLPPSGSVAEGWREKLAMARQPEPPPPSWHARLLGRARGLGVKPARQERVTALPRVTLPPALGPSSPTMDACRLLRGNLALGVDEKEFPPLVVISPDPEAESALVAAGLALALAEEERRTLLVDADMRSPLLHRMFSLNQGPGFAEMLAAGSANGVRPVMVTEMLSVLPAGTPTFSPAVIFRRNRAGQVVEELATLYDVVIYHIAGNWTSPELLAFTPRVGQALFTIRAGRESAEHIRRIKGPLERTGVRLLGFALVGGKQ